MGMYDNLKEYQVKCFPISNILIEDEICNFLPTEKDSNFTLKNYYINGELRWYNRGHLVPYKTLYYNYGLDFMIFHYQDIFYNIMDIPIHIIKDGIYRKSVLYSKLSNRYSIFPVIDNAGSLLNIETVGDFKDLLGEAQYYMKKYHDYLGDFSIVEYFKTDEFKNKSSKEMVDICNRYDDFSSECYNKSLKIFNENWKSSKELYSNIVGQILDFLLRNDDEKIFLKIVERFWHFYNIKDIEDYVLWFNRLKLSQELSSESVLEIFNNPSKENIDKKLGWVKMDLPCFQHRLYK